MDEEAVEVRKLKFIAYKKILQRRCELAVYQRRQFGTEHDAEAVVFDVPAHDVLRAAPAPFAGGENARPAVRSVFSVVQEHPGGAIAEQSGGDEHRRPRIVDPQAQAAKIDRENQHMRTVTRL